MTANYNRKSMCKETVVSSLNLHGDKSQLKIMCRKLKTHNPGSPEYEARMLMAQLMNFGGPE